MAIEAEYQNSKKFLPPALNALFVFPSSHSLNLHGSIQICEQNN